MQHSTGLNRAFSDSWRECPGKYQRTGPLSLVTFNTEKSSSCSSSPVKAMNPANPAVSREPSRRSIQLEPRRLRAATWLWWLPFRSQAMEADHELGQLSGCFDECIDELVRGWQPNGSKSSQRYFDQCRDWYSGYLSQQIQSVQHWLQCSVEKGFLTSDLYTVIARELACQREVTLMNLAEALQAHGSFKQGRYGTWASAQKTVFCLVGWLTFLYDPDVKSMESNNRLSIKDSSAQSIRSLCQTVTSKRQDLKQQDIEQPLNVCLNRFGELVPHIGVEDLGQSQDLYLQHLNFHNLYHVCDIQIEWVNTLSLHLEFDRQHKKLKIFKFPAYCDLVTFSDFGKNSFLHQIFEDKRQLACTSNGDDKDNARAFLLEVLHSFRILFLDDKMSNELFRKILPHECRQDPLLQRLRNGGWSESCHQVALHGEDVYSDYYSSLIDFPHLGKRLVELQEYSRRQAPRMSNDRRDVGTREWQNFRAIVYIGGFTVILGLLQIFLSALQLWRQWS